jgi:DNA-binding protein HU-beta
VNWSLWVKRCVSIEPPGRLLSVIAPGATFQGAANAATCHNRHLSITIRKYGGDMSKLMSKSELIQKIAEQHSNSITRKDVKGVIESLATIGYKELKKSGVFLVPGFAKFVVIKKPATKERSGINPFTKQPTIFKAKPARKIVRARPVKAAKDAVL